MTWGPRIQSSPDSPTGTSCSVATSTIRHSVFGTAGPIEPGIVPASLSMTQCVVGLVSVSP